jgi:hypothetical protein
MYLVGVHKPQNAAIKAMLIRARQIANVGKAWMLKRKAYAILHKSKTGAMPVIIATDALCRGLL